MVFQMKSHDSWTWWVNLHNSYDMPVSSEWNGFVELGYHHWMRLSWKLQSFRLLGSPYRTNCRHYRASSEHLSRKDCIRKCRINTSLKMCKVIHEGVDVYRDDPVVYFAQNSDVDCIKGIDFDAICEKECPHYDCAIDYYEPVVLHYKAVFQLWIKLP